MLLGFCLIGWPVYGQAPPPPLILSLPASVRFAALGGASVALNGDAASVFGNPAGLATIKHVAVEAGFARYPDGTLESMGAGAFRLLQFDLGGAYHYVRFSDTSATKDNLVWVGSAVFRYGIFALGNATRYVSVEDTLGVINRAITTDAGLEIAIFDIMALGVGVRNLANSRLTGAPLTLPTSTHVGFSLNFTDPQLTTRLLGTMEVIWTKGRSRRTILGAEAGVVLSGLGLVARVGYGAQPEGSDIRQLSVGGGAILGRLGLDYAYQRRFSLGNHVHRLGLRFTL